MLSYKLAEKLQQVLISKKIYWEDADVCDISCILLVGLIDICVKNIPYGDFHLEHFEDRWSAGNCYQEKCVGYDEWTTGKTPEEAVAKLIIKILK